MKMMKCMHSENVALLNFLCFEINNIKYKNLTKKVFYEYED